MDRRNDKEGATFAAPGDLLFSLPTICDWMPPLTERILYSGEILALHEDDWRQVELIAYEYCDDIEAMLAGIYDIYEKERSPGGAFRRIFVRDRIADPLSLKSIKVDTLRTHFQDATDYHFLGYEAFEGIVEGGFTWRTGGGLLVYGRHAGNVLHTLCLEILGRGPGLEKDRQVLEDFCRAHRLVLVDWCFCEALLPQEEGFRTYFSPSGRGYRSIGRRP
ncbi:MAG: hypothetical protein RDV48_29115 [Candidatus Eremiobacteraeota bacterium]|nr:hypothetical protein [Candidatus Eremiobacteraeota bacterium]